MHQNTQKTKKMCLLPCCAEKTPWTTVGQAKNYNRLIDLTSGIWKKRIDIIIGNIAAKKTHQQAIIFEDESSQIQPQVQSQVQPLIPPQKKQKRNHTWYSGGCGDPNNKLLRSRSSPQVTTECLESAHNHQAHPNMQRYNASSSAPCSINMNMNMNRNINYNYNLLNNGSIPIDSPRQQSQTQMQYQHHMCQFPNDGFNFGATACAGTIPTVTNAPNTTNTTNTTDITNVSNADKRQNTDHCGNINSYGIGNMNNLTNLNVLHNYNAYTNLNNINNINASLTDPAENAATHHPTHCNNEKKRNITQQFSYSGVSMFDMQSVWSNCGAINDSSFVSFSFFG